MKAPSEGVNVNILGKEFMVACPEHQRRSLEAAADYLDEKMREIQASGKVIGAERCAIMAALNIANDFLQIQGRDGISQETGQKLRFLQSKIEAVLQQ
ncbi:MAG: cell division protein ZapA [Gammaproteobacteria bacterium]|nr:MAG: cell division protein ZapA [Gammaproteobacteria bacterium]